MQYLLRRKQMAIHYYKAVKNIYLKKLLSLVATFFYLKTKILIKMKNFFKVATLLMAVILFTVSSCKKDEQIIEGCTDNSAMNYQSLATSDDGSCIYAYFIALGTWNIDSECEELTITIFGQSFDVPLNEIFPETIEITGEGDNVVSMDINGNSVLADVANDGVVLFKIIKQFLLIQDFL